MIKLLIGGSPCTFWSIAQKNGRETEAEGLGWELFKNFLIAKKKFNPDFFLYENNKSAAQAHRVYSCEGKSVTINAGGGGQGGKTGLYLCPTTDIRKPFYEVRNGKIVINGVAYDINLADGIYCIRKLTPVECERLQTLPDGYTKAVSNAQRYKGLGNGWTAEVIIHLLNGALSDVPRDEEIVVLSMYDGIGTGRYCLDKMGFTNVRYFAYEIDKYAKQVAMSNYPDIIQLGDAFDMRHPDWTIGY